MSINHVADHEQWLCSFHRSRSCRRRWENRQSQLSILTRAWESRGSACPRASLNISFEMRILARATTKYGHDRLRMNKKNAKRFRLGRCDLSRRIGSRWSHRDLCFSSSCLFGAGARFIACATRRCVIITCFDSFAGALWCEKCAKQFNYCQLEWVVLSAGLIEKY